MKRLTTIISAILFVLCLSECRKELRKVTPEVVEAYAITLSVDGGGSKLGVDPGSGEVSFTNGDVIYVAYKGKYVGTLTHDGACFSGSLSVSPPSTPTDNLCFYFLGNKTPHSTLVENSSTSISIDIIDQTTPYPVISAAASEQLYTEGVTNYTATLANQCALVKFLVTTSQPSVATCVSVTNNKLTVDLTKNTIDPLTHEITDAAFSFGRMGDGTIKLASGNGERWAILLPQPAMSAGADGSAYSEDLEYIGTRAAIKEVKKNGYLKDGVIVNVDKGYDPIIVSDNYFSVSAAKKVRFSRGNLQYIGSAATPYWWFAMNQFDVIGDNGQGSDNKNVNRDLFGWGCTGNKDAIYNSNQECYFPYDVAMDNSKYGPTGFYSLSVGRNSDWGCLTIANGVGYEWRTLSKDEWYYLINSRPSNRFLRAQVNSVNGLIVFPDDWSGTIYTNIDNHSATFESTLITKEDWINDLEPKGAVFLPTAGYRNGTTLAGVYGHGYYWASDTNKDQSAYRFCFYPSFEFGRSNKYSGLSYRKSVV